MRPVIPRVPHRIYGRTISGNCHKVRLVCDLLGLQYRWHEVDTSKGESRTPEFLAMNPNGKVPLLQIDANTWLPESGAILCFLAEGTDLWPGDRLLRAQVLGWMFFEQNQVVPTIAIARFLRSMLKAPNDARLPDLMSRGALALETMERYLARHPFFGAPQLTIADIALFAYTHRAHEGGFDLTSYPAVTNWLDRMRALPGISEMPAL